MVKGTIGHFTDSELLPVVNRCLSWFQVGIIGILNSQDSYYEVKKQV